MAHRRCVPGRQIFLNRTGVPRATRPLVDPVAGKWNQQLFTETRDEKSFGQLQIRACQQTRCRPAQSTGLLHSGLHNVQQLQLSLSHSWLTGRWQATRTLAKLPPALCPQCISRHRCSGPLACVHLLGCCLRSSRAFSLSRLTALSGMGDRPGHSPNRCTSPNTSCRSSAVGSSQGACYRKISLSHIRAVAPRALSVLTARACDRASRKLHLAPACGGRFASPPAHAAADVGAWSTPWSRSCSANQARQR
jgi:hypothetical protein